MALVDLKNKPTVPKPTTGQAKPAPMRTAVVETRFTPVQDILTHISGSRYVVDYYQQLLGVHDHPKPLDISIQPAHQSYNRIKNFEMRLQGDLSQSADQQTKEFEVTGEAIMYPGVVPNDGDMFIADTAEGKWGVFAVTASYPLSMYQQTCYRIQFRLIAVADQNRLNDLTRKTATENHFVMDFLRAGKNPIIIDDVYASYRDLDRLKGSVLGDYLRRYYSEVVRSLIVPGQAGGAYDPFLVKAFLSIMEVEDHPLLRDLQRHSVDIAYAYNTTTLWDALLNIEPGMLYLCNRKCGLVNKNIIRDRGVFGGAYWTKISQVVYPMDQNESVDRQFIRITETSGAQMRDGGAPLSDLEYLILNTDISVNAPIVDDEDVAPNQPRVIPNVNEDFYYVFTKAFYDNNPAEMSQLESFVWSFLNHNEIDVVKLVKMFELSRTWDKLEQFYFIPVLLLIAIVALRGPSHG